MTSPMLRDSTAVAARECPALPPGAVQAGRHAPMAPLTADPPPSLGRLGDLEVRLAAGRDDLRRAQRLRYKVFFEHGHARPSLAAARQRRDLCPFDAACDHLIVIDHAAPDRRLGGSRAKVVGTYRLLRQAVAERHLGFYTAGEFAIAALLARHPDKTFLELGRSCVLPRYRGRRTIELLWRGIWAYVQHHRIEVLFGCASFPGTDPDALARPLSALRRFAAAAPAWQVGPVAGRGAVLRDLAPEPLERREALAGLPPLIKGYLRAGARFGDGIVVDTAFGTTDILAVLPLADLDSRYLAHFGAG